MMLGKMLRGGDIKIASLQFTDSAEVKTRPAVVLFEESGNIMIAGITSNQKMKGIPLTKNEGAIKDERYKNKLYLHDLPRNGFYSYLSLKLRKESPHI